MSLALPQVHDQLPDSLSGSRTLFHLCEQELLDLAAICQLAAPQSESRARVTLDELAVEHDKELVANQATRAALLDAEIAFTAEDLAQRKALLQRLPGDYEFRQKLRAERADLAADIARLEIELYSRSHAAERDLLQQELTEVRTAQNAQTQKDGELAPSMADEPRQRQIDELRRRKAEILHDEENTFAREEDLRQRMITRTIAGFLLWLGYASVVATGSVLALIMSGSQTFELKPLMAGIHAVASSVFPGWPQWLRLVTILAIVLGLFRLLIAAFLWCDDLLRDRWKWHEEKRRTDATAQMAPQALTTRTYARFIALLPFAFAVAAIVAIASSAPGAGGNSTNTEQGTTLLASIFPSVGYSFVGITIAFLATAVFVMYFVAIMQPRTRGTHAFRASWEFAIPPLLLLTAIVLLPMQRDITLTRWIPWAGFMLASSIALAAGLVFHGIFKDARRAHDRIARIDRKLQRLSGLPSEEDDDETSATTQPLARRRRLLERLISRLPFKHIKPSALAVPVQPQAPPSGDAPSSSPPLSAPTQVTARYRPIDLTTAPDVIVKIEEGRAALSRVDADLQTADATISALEAAASFEVINDVGRRLHFLRGLRDALASHQEERRHHATIAKDLLALKITTTEIAAKSINPLLGGIREMLLQAKATTEGAQ